MKFDVLQKLCSKVENHVTDQEFHKKSPDSIYEIRSGSGLAKAESIFHKIFDRSKKSVGGKNLWSRSTKFENIVGFVTFILWNPIFLGPTYFLWNRICEFRFRKLSIPLSRTL